MLIQKIAEVLSALVMQFFTSVIRKEFHIDFLVSPISYPFGNEGRCAVSLKFTLNQSITGDEITDSNIIDRGAIRGSENKVKCVTMEVSRNVNMLDDIAGVQENFLLSF